MLHGLLQPTRATLPLNSSNLFGDKLLVWYIPGNLQRPHFFLDLLPLRLFGPTSKDKSELDDEWEGRINTGSFTVSSTLFFTVLKAYRAIDAIAVASFAIAEAVIDTESKDVAP